MPRGNTALALALAVVLSACVDKLPLQDGRIVDATAVAKMPVDDLVKEYQTDAAGADRRYFSRAVEVSGKVGTIHQAPTDTTLVFTDTTGAEILHAVLLDDSSKGIVTGLDTDRRIRLKCYADKFAGHVMLRSCVKP